MIPVNMHNNRVCLRAALVRAHLLVGSCLKVSWVVAIEVEHILQDLTDGCFVYCFKRGSLRSFWIFGILSSGTSLW